MGKLYDSLLPLLADGKVHKINYIPTANVPIIKLVGDLEVINQIQIEKAMDRAKYDKIEEMKRKGEEVSDIVELDF